MARTTFSGPVASDNGFISGTATDEIAVTTASNVSSSYVTASNTTGDVRLNYSRLTFTSTGSGETARFLTRVTGAGAATGGTVNGAHISLSINGSGTISGAGNALRVTLGGSSTAPGGTISAIQLDSDFASGGSWSGATYLRCTNSGTGTIGALLRVPAPAVAGVFRAAVGSPVVTHTIPVISDNGTTYYIMCSTVA
ncbi:MAG: hypothetical protein RL275_138 [Chloroflexota bacterium]|jgi:hypothetical protein